MVRAVFISLANLFDQSASRSVLGVVVVSGFLLLVFLFWRFRAQRCARLNQAHFSRQLISVQEEERARIARELHDGLGQDLLVIKNTAAMAASKEPESEHWEQISELSSNVLSEVRDLSHTLRLPVLDSLGLTRALRSMATQLTDSAGLVCEIALEDIDDLLPPEVEISLFRSAQELIGNAVRHSQGATIKLLAKPIGNQVLLRVSDDGCGYNPQRLAKRGLGINSVRERVGLLGGEYDVDTAPQQGTRVTIRIPVPEPPLGSEERQRQQSQRQRLAFASGLALVAMVFGTFYLLLSGRMDDAAAQQAEVESARTAIHQALGLPSVTPAQPTPSPDGGKTNIPPNRKTSATRRTARFRPG